MHGTRVYFAGVNPKGPALEKFPDIKKIKNRTLATYLTYPKEGKKMQNIDLKHRFNYIIFPISSIFINLIYVICPFISLLNFVFN